MNIMTVSKTIIVGGQIKIIDGYKLNIIITTAGHGTATHISVKGTRTLSTFCGLGDFGEDAIRHRKPSKVHPSTATRPTCQRCIAMANELGEVTR